MATAIMAGYFALGTGFSSSYTFQEVSGGSYVRIIVNNSGNYSTGTTQTISTWAAAAAPAGLPMRLGAIFDASTAGNLIAWFEMPGALTTVGTAQPSTVYNITLLGNIIAAMGQGTGEVFAAGSQIGTVSGSPLIAGNNLINSTSGQLTYEPAQGTTIINPIIYVGGVPVARWDSSGNMTLKGTLTSSGTV